MDFADRAVEMCRKDFVKGMVCEMHIRAILKCKDVNVNVLLPFLKNVFPDIRMAASRIIVSKGNAKEVVEALLSETESTNVFQMIKLIGERGEGLELLEGMIESEDTIVRDSIVEMFRKAGKADSLVALLFNDDDKIVRRVKRYIDETGQG